MNIKLENTGIELHLPVDFELETTFKNPLFSKDEGSGTLPAVLPPTPHNFASFGFPERIDNADKISQQRVRVTSGIYQRIGTATVLDASKHEGININIGFDEGEFWNKINNLPLNKLEWETIDYGSAENAVAYMNKLLTRQINNPDLSIFEIILDYATDDTHSERYKLNDITKTNSTWSLKHQSIWNEWVKSNNQWVNVTNPVGYGISPFLKVGALIEKIFTALGYKVTANPFRSGQLQHLVALNNNRDSIVSGKLKLSHLVPSCTANELLDALFAKFGALPFVNSNDRTVSIRLIKDILKEPAQKDLTIFLNTGFKNYFERGKQLRLSSEKSIENKDLRVTAKTTHDTFKEFTDLYSNKFNIFDNTIEILWKPQINTIVAYSRVGNSFYSWNLKNNSDHDLPALSSFFFDWDQKHADFDYLDIKGIDEQVPMTDSGNTDIIFDIPAFLCGISNNNSGIIVKGEMVETKNENTCPLAFCLVHDAALPGITFGSSFSHNPIKGGNSNITIDLCYYGERGLFNNFMKEYDRYLRHGLQKTESSYMLSEADKQLLDITRPVMSNNQMFLIEELKTKIGKKTPSQLVLRTLSLKHPYQDDYQFIEPAQATHYWKYVNQWFELKKFRNNLISKLAFPPHKLQHGIDTVAVAPMIYNYGYYPVGDVPFAEADIEDPNTSSFMDTFPEALGDEQAIIDYHHLEKADELIYTITKPDSQPVPIAFPNEAGQIFKKDFLFTAIIWSTNRYFNLPTPFKAYWSRTFNPADQFTESYIETSPIKANIMFVVAKYSTYFEKVPIPGV